MARVCARRAVGIVIGEFLQRFPFQRVNPSSYDRLTAFIDFPGIEPELVESARRFLIKVDADHQLPPGIDLIQDAQRMAEKLLFYQPG